MSIDLKENESYLVEEILPKNEKNKKKIIYKSFEDLSNNAENIFIISRPIKIFKIHYKYLINNINLIYFAQAGTLEEKLFLAKQGLCIEFLILDLNEYVRTTINKYLTEDIFSKLDNLTLHYLARNKLFPNLISKSDDKDLKMIFIECADSIKSCNYFLNDKDIEVRTFAENKKEYIKNLRCNNG